MHVLIVDDSAVVRQTVGGLLQNEADITVSVASDPLIAMQKIAAQRPDVILLDIQMPRMDGLTFLRKLMAEDPIPVVICSSVAGEQTFAALQHGAIDVVGKPRVGLREFLNESRVLLVDALRAAASANLCSRRLSAAAPVRGSARMPKGRPRAGHYTGPSNDSVIAIGASTGGTEALRAILAEMPATSPGTLIVQHMPEGFTAQFAKHLHNESAMDVKEAADRDRLTAGVALVAPGNRHMQLARDRNGWYVVLDDGPLVSRHRPSVDVLFRSVAAAAGADATGVILTGMGSDGADGLREMKTAGARTIAQDERTCVVFGMPKEAIARGAVDEVLPLEGIAAAVTRVQLPRGREAP